MAKSTKGSVNRRGFLRGAAAGAAAGAASLVTPPVEASQQVASQPSTPALAARILAAEARPAAPDVEVLTVDNPGSDFMVDVFKMMKFDYIAANPASSFRG